MNDVLWVMGTIFAALMLIDLVIGFGLAIYMLWAID